MEVASKGVLKREVFHDLIGVAEESVVLIGYGVDAHESVLLVPRFGFLHWLEHVLNAVCALFFCLLLFTSCSCSCCCLR